MWPPTAVARNAQVFERDFRLGNPPLGRQVRASSPQPEHGKTGNRKLENWKRTGKKDGREIARQGIK